MAQRPMSLIIFPWALEKFVLADRDNEIDVITSLLFQNRSCCLYCPIFSTHHFEIVSHLKERYVSLQVCNHLCAYVSQMNRLYVLHTLIFFFCSSSQKSSGIVSLECSACITKVSVWGETPKPYFFYFGYNCNFFVAHMAEKFKSNIVKIPKISIWGLGFWTWVSKHTLMSLWERLKKSIKPSVIDMWVILTWYFHKPFSMSISLSC